jgi:hypothetical protein
MYLKVIYHIVNASLSSLLILLSYLLHPHSSGMERESVGLNGFATSENGWTFSFHSYV